MQNQIFVYVACLKQDISALLFQMMQFKNVKLLACIHSKIYFGLYAPKPVHSYRLLIALQNIFQGTLIHRMVRGVTWLGAGVEKSFPGQYLVNVKLNKFLFKL